MSDRPDRGGTRLATRFLIVYALTYIVLIGLMGLIIERATHATLVSDVLDNLEVEAGLLNAGLPDDPVDYQSWAHEMFAVGGFRVTVIDTNGVVLADSHSDPAVMENHSTRPEVVAALAGRVGRADRMSFSTGFEQLYVAVPPENGVIVRVSLPTRVLASELGGVRTSIIATVAIIGLIGIVLVALLARRMARPIEELTAQSQALAAGTLDVAPRRSPVREIDQLGLAISDIARDLGTRLVEMETAAETLEVVLGAMPQGTILLDDDDRIAYANPSARQILGTLPDRLGGIAPLQLQQAVRDARVSHTTEVRTGDHGKPPRRLRGIATPFTDDDRVLLVVVDVTERERTDSIRKDFVANASHELKTPVSTIIASAEALQIAVEREDENAAGFAAQIERSARQLDRLVGDLLDLSRLERETPELAAVRLDLLVREQMERVRERAETKGITIVSDCPDTTVHASHRDVAIAVRNLLDNAVRHTGSGGQIAARISTDGGETVLSIEDTGEGIPTRDLERVFERFYRVDSARSRDTGGTGLGLSIVKHVAESHGGSVAVESELGAGSTFTVRLPMFVEGEDTPRN